MFFKEDKIRKMRNKNNNPQSRQTSQWKLFCLSFGWGNVFNIHLGTKSRDSV